MKKPSELTNDNLALNIELWTMINQELTEGQKRYFEEVVWRLRMMADKEKENNNGQ